MRAIVDVNERRSELAAAAARVIARAGVAGANLRDVAAEAGLTTGALTHYFADKRELLLFTFEVSLDGRRARRHERASMLPADALRAALVQALPIDDDARLHWAVTIAFCAQAAGDIELASIQRDAYRDFRANVTDLVRVSGRASGRSARPEAERLIALLDGVALQAMFDPESWPARRQLAVLDAELALAR